MKSIAISIFVCTAICTSSVFAQENAPVTRDIGISVSRFSFENIPLTLVYKKGRENKFWRYELLSFNGNLELPATRLDTIKFSDKRSGFGLGFALAREKRKPLTEKFTFYHGVRFGLSAAYNHRTNYNHYSSFSREMTNSDYHVRPFIGYSIGAIFHLNESLYLSAQLSPSAYYQLTYNKATRKNVSVDPGFISSEADYRVETFEHNTGFSFDQGAVQVGVFYTFTK